MLLTLNAANFNQLLKSLKTADVPRPILTERFKVMDEIFYEVHIADRHIPQLLIATTQPPDYITDLGIVLQIVQKNILQSN